MKKLDRYSYKLRYGSNKELVERVEISYRRFIKWIVNNNINGEAFGNIKEAGR